MLGFGVRRQNGDLVWIGSHEGMSRTASAECRSSGQSKGSWTNCMLEQRLSEGALSTRQESGKVQCVDPLDFPFQQHFRPPRPCTWAIDSIIISDTMPTA